MQKSDGESIADWHDCDCFICWLVRRSRPWFWCLLPSVVSSDELTFINAMTYLLDCSPWSLLTDLPLIHVGRWIRHGSDLVQDPGMDALSYYLVQGRPLQHSLGGSFALKISFHVGYFTHSEILRKTTTALQCGRLFAPAPPSILRELLGGLERTGHALECKERRSAFVFFECSFAVSSWEDASRPADCLSRRLLQPK